ncbi:MAG: hypothetical protein CO099_02550, partial [Bdellovibrio sp. CG_4_9_14_3_um_filter_39_7]
FKPASLATPLFESKEDAIEGAVKVNQMFKSGSISREEARTLANRYQIHCGSSGSGNGMAMNEIERQIRKGSIVAIGFIVEQSFTPDGKPLYRAIGNYLLPCATKD